jgi:hypothetical protein
MEQSGDEEVRAAVKLLNETDERERRVYRAERELAVPLEQAASVPDMSEVERVTIDRSPFGPLLERFRNLDGDLRANLIEHLHANLERGANPASQLVTTMQRMEQMAKFGAAPDDAEEVKNDDERIRGVVEGLLDDMKKVDAERRKPGTAKPEQKPEEHAASGYVN